MKYILIIFVLVNIYSILTHACFVPKTEQVVDIKELISRTSNIYLAKVTDFKAGKAVFKVSKVLKGEKKKIFSIKAGKDEEKIDTDFSGHKEQKFWKNKNEGRVNISPDCTIFPSFSVGEQYLVFYDQPYHFKSFEQILSKEDKWFNYVDSALESNGLQGNDVPKKQPNLLRKIFNKFFGKG